MPVILDDSGNETVVSDSRFKQLRREVDADRQDKVAFAAHETDNTSQLWDYIDEGWTKNLPRAQLEDQSSKKVYQAYLDKVIIKCSACTFTTVFDSGMRQHLLAVKEQVEAHQGAIIRETDSGVRVCSGCACTFQNQVR